MHHSGVDMLWFVRNGHDVKSLTNLLCDVAQCQVIEHVEWVLVVAKKKSHFCKK